MAIGTVGFNGARLEQAREARGMTAVHLADLVGVTPQTISQYEHSVQTPRPEVTDKLSTCLNVNRAYFTQEIGSRVNERVFYRSIAATTKTARVRAKRRLEWFKEIVAYLEEFITFPPLNLPEFDVPQDFREITSDLIERYAEETRKHWGLGVTPISNVVKVLESNGIFVSRGYLQADGFDAFSENDTPERFFVFLGADKNIAVRSRFDSSHELGHRILHRHLKNISGSTLDFKSMEEQAHRFANAFLLPQEAFTKDLWGPTLDAFWSLKPRWKVSIAAMIMRSKDLELISEEQTKKLFINLNRRGWRKLEPLDDKMESETPKLLKHCFEMLIDEGVKSKTQIVDELCLSANDIEELAGLPRGYLNEDSGNFAKGPMLKIDGKTNVIPFRGKEKVNGN